MAGLATMMEEVLRNQVLSNAISKGGIMSGDDIFVSEISMKWIGATELFDGKRLS